MRPKERRDSGQNDLFRARLDQIVDLDHPLAKLGRAIDWRFLEARFGAVYSDKAGHPPLPTRLMAGLSILKHMHNLSDEDLCARWIENPYYQLFCGEEFFRHKLTFDRSSLTRWRQRVGEERLAALIQESLAVATRTGAARPADFSKVIVDTTVQPKAVAFPTDAKLMHRARERMVKLAKKTGVSLRQSYARVGKHALIAHQRYAHAKQFNRANRALKTIRTYLGRVIRDIVRKIEGEAELESAFAHPLMLARRVREQRQHQRGKKSLPSGSVPRVYSLHAPEVECIGKSLPSGLFSARTGEARIGYRPSKKSIQRVVDKVHALTDRAGTWQETTTLVGKVNRTLTRGARRIVLMSSASRSRSPQPSIAPGAASSSPTPRRCRATLTMATHSPP